MPSPTTPSSVFPSDLAPLLTDIALNAQNLNWSRPTIRHKIDQLLAQAARQQRHLPDDCFLAYYLMHEAWYADTVKRDEPCVMICAASTGGGAAWEFSITEHDLGGRCIKLRMFSDSFDAFVQIPDFFTRLRTELPSTLREVQELLDSMGAVDTTERNRPSHATVPATLEGE